MVSLKLGPHFRNKQAVALRPHLYRMRDPGTAGIVISSPSARALLFLAGWNGVDILFRERFRFRRAPKLGRYAITSPQLGALDRSDEFAAHRFLSALPEPAACCRPLGAA